MTKGVHSGDNGMQDTTQNEPDGVRDTGQSQGRNRRKSGYLEHYITDYIADLSNIDDDDSEAQNNFVGFTTETGDS